METTTGKICAVYEIRNLIDNKVYVGQSVNLKRRWRDHRKALDSSRHGNCYLQHAWVKHGSQAFAFNILEECAEEELNEREAFHIESFNSLSRNSGYNLEVLVGGRKQISEETRAKMAASKIGRPMHPATLAAFPGCHKGRTRSEEFKENLRRLNTGKNASEETRQRLSESHKGHFPTEETRSKLSEAGKGRAVSEETRAKISLANKGRKRTPEQLSAMSELRKAEAARRRDHET